ncbi:hypothetical protein LCGC14_2163970 [marine sediment metagenome]|uniref:DUF5675 domain-containing protein n=1 Tax=marine sediment metagenome TaxID=412755 RepID=A0A0F9GN19_9ZZZZ
MSYNIVKAKMAYTMKSMTLKRVTTIEGGTFGVLIDQLVPFALTLELPWKDNKPFVSCIPSGIYTCERIKSPKFGHTFRINDVPDRYDILFHRGNIKKHTEGCIVVGEQFEYLYDKVAVLASKKGFKEFMSRLKKETVFSLLVTWS